jgi:hypothetical protein
MLHIHNGDASADTARQTSLPGEHLAWRESLITGPTPAGLSGDEWRRIRAQHLSASYEPDLQECEAELLRQEEALAAFAGHDEVVLWFEHDLFCQLHLLYLLNWFSQSVEIGGEIERSVKTKLSLICIGEFPGKENFRGLGELNAEELASLFPARAQVTPEQLSLAATAWAAYCSPDPTEIENVLRTDTSALPFLQAALQAHLRRFPATTNGLGRIENRALELIEKDVQSFADLFARFGALEPVYGLGDAQFWLALQRLSLAPKPLITIAKRRTAEDNADRNDRDPQALTPEVVQNARCELTELGRSALKAEVDFIALNGIDLWLGGVHLHDEDRLWRWDEESARIQRQRREM